MLDGGGHADREDAPQFAETGAQSCQPRSFNWPRPRSRRKIRKPAAMKRAMVAAQAEPTAPMAGMPKPP
ncbi:MAG: hypothetical protein U0841_23145 [Chloroflexia bacterium]